MRGGGGRKPRGGEFVVRVKGGEAGGEEVREGTQRDKIGETATEDAGRWKRGKGRREKRVVPPGPHCEEH